MFRAGAAAAFALALTLVPSGATDPVHPSASAAEADDPPALNPPVKASRPANVGDALDGAQPAAFGFGAKTGFYPSLSPRELVLTFDDGPDLKYTPIVLDELDRRGLKAIFFITGHRLIGDRPEDVARRELVRKIAARGHLVGNHTMTHRDLCQFPDEAAAEIDANAEVLTAVTGVRPLLFRAPYGARCRKLEAALAARGLVSVGWNLDPQDWKNTSIRADPGLLVDAARAAGRTGDLVAARHARRFRIRARRPAGSGRA